MASLQTRLVVLAVLGSALFGVLPIIQKTRLANVARLARKAQQGAANSALGQGITSRFRRYGKFAGAAAVGGAGYGLGKIPGVKKVGRAVKSGWQNVKAADRSLEILEEARKASRQKEINDRASAMLNSQGKFGAAAGAYGGSSLADIRAKLESKSLEEAMSRLERSMRDQNITAGDLRTVAAGGQLAGKDMSQLGVGTLAGHRAIAQKLMDADMLTADHVQHLTDSLEDDSDKFDLINHINSQALKGGHKNIGYGGLVQGASGDLVYDQYALKPPTATSPGGAAAIVDSGLSGVSKESFDDPTMLNAIRAKAQTSQEALDEIVRQTMHIDKDSVKRQLAANLYGHITSDPNLQMRYLEDTRASFRSDKR